MTSIDGGSHGVTLSMSDLKHVPYAGNHWKYVL